jgi:RimJ/RimL family protein N-acetyltransferase
MLSFEKLFPPQLSLKTERVLLRPMLADDFDAYCRITDSDSLWKYFTKELNDKSQLKEWMDMAMVERKEEKRFPFTIVEKSSGAVCGSTSFGNISIYDRRIEVGWSWLAESYLGSGINMHAKYALLNYAFEVLDFERVEIKTDNLNERAKNALKKIGATEEGVLRSHMQMPNNRRRDSVYFSILSHEWNAIKERVFKEVS